MINIVTDETQFKRGELLVDNESFFNVYVSAKSFKRDSLDVMRNIDNATILDYNTGSIQTPYGVCGIERLSTGCKTVLNYLWLRDHLNEFPDLKCINVTECGWNALEELFKLMERDKDTMPLLLQHNDTYRCSRREYYVNGKLMKHGMLWV